MKLSLADITYLIYHYAQTRNDRLFRMRNMQLYAACGPGDFIAAPARGSPTTLLMHCMQDPIFDICSR